MKLEKEKIRQLAASSRQLRQLANAGNLSPQSWLALYFGILTAMLMLAFLVLAPYSFWWLYQSGDAAVERAVSAQASGKFALFGSGLSQDFVDYKLKLYAAAKPEIASIGSSRVMQFRGAWFRERFLNMGGVAGNLAVLRSTVDAMLKLAKPQAVIIGIDFWWFLPQWEANPDKHVSPTSGTYNYSLASLKKTWEWLFTGKISPAEFAGPILGLFGKGMRVDRYGIMAQQTDDGFGPDGSWYYTGEITGQKQAFDYQFHDTLQNARLGLKAFYHAKSDQAGPQTAHLDAFSEICCRLSSRGIKTFVFIPPLAHAVLAVMNRNAYPHLFKLRDALLERGIDVMDFTDPRSFGGNDCEFVDGFHGGEVTYARILRAMADRWPALLAYVNMEKLDAAIRDWQGNALVPDIRLTPRQETDFLGLGCHKRQAEPLERTKP